VYKKTKLDFHNAMGATEAKALYGKFLESVTAAVGVDRCQGGEFGAYMEVAFVSTYINKPL
jgi:D-Tyr-tRNAtyr deacylase